MKTWTQKNKIIEIYWTVRLLVDTERTYARTKTCQIFFSITFFRTLWDVQTERKNLFIYAFHMALPLIFLTFFKKKNHDFG